MNPEHGVKRAAGKPADGGRPPTGHVDPYCLVRANFAGQRHPDTLRSSSIVRSRYRGPEHRSLNRPAGRLRTSGLVSNHLHPTPLPEPTPRRPDHRRDDDRCNRDPPPTNKPILWNTAGPTITRSKASLPDDEIVAGLGHLEGRLPVVADEDDGRQDAALRVAGHRRRSRERDRPSASPSCWPSSPRSSPGRPSASGGTLTRNGNRRWPRRRGRRSRRMTQHTCQWSRKWLRWAIDPRLGQAHP